MRLFIRGTLFLIAAGMVSGCGCTKPAASATTQVADAKAWMMQSGGVNVLKLTTAVDVKCVAKDGSLHFTAPQYEVEFWLAPGAKTVDEAIGSVPTQIASEFKDFQAGQTIDLTIAGSPAKQLIGPGHEADDDDPGDAAVIVFKVGTKIFVGCTHGESLNPFAEAGMLAIVQTAQQP